MPAKKQFLLRNKSHLAPGRAFSFSPLSRSVWKTFTCNRLSPSKSSISYSYRTFAGSLSDQAPLTVRASSPVMPVKGFVFCGGGAVLIREPSFWRDLFGRWRGVIINQSLRISSCVAVLNVTILVDVIDFLFCCAEASPAVCWWRTLRDKMRSRRGAWFLW